MKQNKSTFPNKQIATWLLFLTSTTLAWSAGLGWKDANSNLVHRVLVAETKDPSLFTQFEETLQSWYKTNQTDKPMGNRPGVFTGVLWQFVSQEPETAMVSEGFLYSTSNGVIRMSHKNIRKYSDAEILAGRHRNQIARMAVLKHILTRLHEDGVYEQNEFLNFILEIWGEGHFQHEERYVNEDQIGDISQLVQSLAEDHRLTPSMRIQAALYLHEAKRMDDAIPILRGIVTNLPPDKSSVILVRSLESIAGFVPEAADKLKAIRADDGAEAPSANDKLIQ